MYLANGASGTSIKNNLISGNLRDGITITSSSGNNTVITGNDIGTDATGMHALGNGSTGLYTQIGNITIVGNLVSANGGGTATNGSVGIVISSLNLPISGVIVQGNRIGTDAAGNPTLGNVGDGILVSDGVGQNVTGVQIGGTTAGTANIIAGNGGAGVDMVGTATFGNPIQGNSIFANGGLGIDLGGSGVPLPNGTPPPGPNDFQNHPIITAATSSSISGYLSSTPNTMFDLEFFASPNLAMGGQSGEGQTLLQSVMVTTDGTGLATFNLSGLTIDPNDVVTATATNLVTGDTSEFSAGPPATIQLSSGNNQNTVVGTAFGSVLQVDVEDAYGAALSGVTVTFAAPGSGASATFGSALAVTDASGVAFTTATANTVAGSYMVTATVNGVSTSFSLTNNPGAANSITVTSGGGQALPRSTRPSRIRW